MNCINCKTSVDNAMLHRTAPKGETPANWMCEECMKKVEPDLWTALQEDKKDEPIINTLNKLFY